MSSEITSAETLIGMQHCEACGFINHWTYAALSNCKQCHKPLSASSAGHWELPHPHADPLVEKIEMAIRVAADLGARAYDAVDGRGLYRSRVEIETDVAALRSASSAARSPDQPSGETLSVREMQEINALRSARWMAGSPGWTTLEVAGELAGEVGELANVCKKLRRSEMGVPGNKVSDAELLQQARGEIADVMIVLMLTASKLGIDLQDAVCETFNAKSEQMGFPERFAARSHPGEQSAPASECAQCGDDGPLQRCPSCGNNLCSTCTADPCDRASSSAVEGEPDVEAELAEVSRLLVEFDGETTHTSVSVHLADLFARLRAAPSSAGDENGEYAANLTDDQYHDALEILCRVFDDVEAAIEEFVAWYKPEGWLGWSRALGAFIRERLSRLRARDAGQYVLPPSTPAPETEQ